MPRPQDDARRPYRAPQVPDRDIQRVRYAPGTGAPAQQRERGSRSRGESFWLYFCGSIGALCGLLLLFQLARLFTGPLSPPRLISLLAMILVYLLSIACGRVWGRSQSALLAPGTQVRQEEQQTLVRRAGTTRTSTRGDSLSGGAHPVAENDALWLGVCILIGLACAIILAIWLGRLFTAQVDATRFIILLLAFALYALCAAAGWLWGRLSYVPALAKQDQLNTTLSTRVERLPQNDRGFVLPRQEGTRRLPENIPTEIKREPDQVRADPSRRVAARSIIDMQREPEDPRDLDRHPHEKLFPLSGEAHTLDYGWRLIGASRRGYGHGYEAKYREDDFEVAILRDGSPGPTLALIALADGVGSKDLSRKGALASVKGATSLTVEQVAPLRALLASGGKPEELNRVAGKLLLRVLHSAYEAIQSEADTLHTSIEELQTTLLCFLVAALGRNQLFLARVQVGDGAMFGMRASTGSDLPPNARWQQLLAPQIQAAGNEVQPFTHSDEQDWRRFIQCGLTSGISGVLAMTDGIADDIEPPLPSPDDPEPDEFTRVDIFYQQIIAPVRLSSRPAHELLKRIGYQKKQSIDDRTLIYLYQV